MIEMNKLISFTLMLTVSLRLMDSLNKVFFSFNICFASFIVQKYPDWMQWMQWPTPSKKKSWW